MDKIILIGYCEYCGEPIYSNQKYMVTIDDHVVHPDCWEDYIYEFYE